MANTRTSIYDVTDDLLEFVLLRLPSPTCLVRAAAVCKPWRRVIADARFLRRFRTLHAPAVAGYYFNRFRAVLRYDIIHTPVFESTSSSSLLPAIDARHFSLDFLSHVTAEFTKSYIVDSRGSLLLMEFRGLNKPWQRFPGALVVCEPSTKLYTRIPPPRDFDAMHCLYETSYLLDGGVANEVGGRIGMSNFRVLCELCHDGIAQTTVFTAGGDTSSWSERAIHDVVPVICYRRQVMGRAAGSWYFYKTKDDVATGIVLDGATGEYSSFMLPDVDEDWDVQNRYNHVFYVTDGYDGKPRILSLYDTTLRVFAKLDGAKIEWVLEKRVTLLLETIRALLGDDDYEPLYLGRKLMNVRYRLSLSMFTRGSGFIILQFFPDESLFFYVNLETMEVKLAKEGLGDIMYPAELPWPPSFYTITDV